MRYRIQPINAHILFIKWYENQTSYDDVAFCFLEELRGYLDGAAHTLYTLSDLSAGCIADVRTLRALLKVTQHHRWGGGITFGAAVRSVVFAGLFQQLSRQELAAVSTLEQALAALESNRPGITAGIDPDALLAGAYDRRVPLA